MLRNSMKTPFIRAAAERCASAAARSGSAADAGGSQLQAVFGSGPATEQVGKRFLSTHAHAQREALMATLQSPPDRLRLLRYRRCTCRAATYPPRRPYRP